MGNTSNRFAMRSVDKISADTCLPRLWANPNLQNSSLARSVDFSTTQIRAETIHPLLDYLIHPLYLAGSRGYPIFDTDPVSREEPSLLSKRETPLMTDRGVSLVLSL